MVVILVALVVAYSFSQENQTEQTVAQKRNVTVYDTVTVHRIISDSMTLEALKRSETFFSNSFSWLLGIVAIAIAIFAFLDRASKKNLDRDIKRELEEQRNLFEKQRNVLNDELNNQKKGINDLIEIALKTDRDKNQEKFDIAFRLLSRIYRKLADDNLEKNDFHEYFYFIGIFYKCLIRIKTLNNYDLSRLHRIFESFSGKKSAGQSPLKNDDNICWFIINLLDFIKRSNNKEESEYFSVAKSIYEILFNYKFDGFTTDTEIREKIKKRMEKDGKTDKEINDILKLTIDHMDNPSII
jgi:hypothetical protein